MKEKEAEDVQSTSIGNGLFTIPNSARPISKKVYDLFTKLKKKAKDADATSSNPAPGQPVQNIEPNLADLQQEAMNSYRLRSDVVKTDNGFEIV